MTSHELAKKLLEGPDVPVVLFSSNYGYDEVADIELREPVSYSPPIGQGKNKK